MSLKNVEDKLYKRDEEIVRKPGAGFGEFGVAESEENPFAPVNFSPKDKEAEAIWIKEKDEKKQERKRKIKKVSLISVGVVVVLGVIVWGALLIRKTAFSEDRVEISISAPERIKSGDLASIEIKFKNQNRVDLKNAVLYVNYSENFKPEGNLSFASEGASSSKYNIGTIAQNSEGTAVLKGKFFGTKDYLTYIKVKLDYNSSNFSSNFEAEKEVGVTISSSPLTLEVKGPQNAASGNTVSFDVAYSNSGQETFHDLKIKADYPRGFNFVSADPIVAQDNNLWYVGDLEGGASGKIRITGSVDGSVGEVKTFKVSIGEFATDQQFISYNEFTSAVKVIGSPITITQEINKQRDAVFVNAGDSLQFTIRFKNTGQIGLRDVILTEQIKSPVLDYGSINLFNSKAAVDASNGTITWNASSVPKFKVLNPGDEGEITFSIGVLGRLPVNSSKDKNFSFTATAHIDSPDVPTPEGSNKVIASNTANLKINSKIVLDPLQGFYNDADIPNSTPMPLKVGQETTFTMHARLTNASNDVTNAKVVMTLAPGIKWKNNFKPQNASVSYNERTGELVWNVGSMAAGTGVLTDKLHLAFQIGVTPSQNQVGQYAPLINSAVFTADDSYTGQKLKTELGVKRTDLFEDISVGESGKVTP